MFNVTRINKYVYISSSDYYCDTNYYNNSFVEDTVTFTILIDLSFAAFFLFVFFSLLMILDTNNIKRKIYQHIIG